jgi:hypothetical protein
MRNPRCPRGRRRPPGLSCAPIWISLLLTAALGAAPTTEPKPTTTSAPVISGASVSGKARMDRTVAVDLRAVDTKEADVARVDWLRLQKTGDTLQGEMGVFFLPSAQGNWRIVLELQVAETKRSASAVIEAPPAQEEKSQPRGKMVRIEGVTFPSGSPQPETFRIRLEPAPAPDAVTHELLALPGTPSGATFTRVYDVRDLFAAADASSSAPSAEATEEAKDERRTQTARRILTMLRQVEPESWGHWGAIRMLRGQLVITQTSDSHRRVLELIRRFRAHPSDLRTDPAALVLPPRLEPEKPEDPLDDSF